MLIINLIQITKTLILRCHLDTLIRYLNTFTFLMPATFALQKF